MQLSYDLIMQIISMILMVFLGFCLSRAHIINAKESRVLSQACVYAFIPCMLFNAFQSDLNQSQLSGLALAFVASIGIHIAVIVAARCLRKTRLVMTAEEEASSIYCNAGNFVVPMIYAISSLGSTYVFYPAAFLLVQNALMWSHGIMLIGHDRNIRWKKILLNPCMISVTLGICCFFLQIRISGPIASAVTSLSGCLGPVSMLVVGILLGEQSAKQIFADKRVYYVVAMRLLVFPLCSIAVLWGLSHIWQHQDLTNILTAMFLCSIGPSASTITQIAQIYKSPSTPYVSTINVVSVILCAVTMPIMLTLFLTIITL